MIIGYIVLVRQYLRRNVIVLMLSIFFYSTPGSAQMIDTPHECNNYSPNLTPNSRYILDTVRGTVLDTNTGLMWQQCSVGQSQVGGSCTGSATALTWQGAFQSAAQANVLNLSDYTDWRLPNIKELHSLVALHCVSPSINTSIFPNTMSSSYWSSSPYLSNIDDASSWDVYFYYGRISYNYRESGGFVRLVR